MESGFSTWLLTINLSLSMENTKLRRKVHKSQVKYYYFLNYLCSIIRTEAPFPEDQVDDIEVEMEEDAGGIEDAQISDRVKMFQELGKKRRGQLIATGEESQAKQNKELVEATMQEDNGQKQKDRVAEMLKELGRRRREQRRSAPRLNHQQREEMKAEADQYPESDNLTEQHIVLESNLVTYGAGLQIHQITSGYDLCQISLQLPIGATRTAIMEIFWEQGLDTSDFHVLRIAETGKMVEAIVLTTVQYGRLLEQRNLGSRKRRVTLHVRRDAVWMSGTMKGPQPSLTLTWDSNRASRRFSKDSASIALAAAYDRLFDSQGVLMETCCLITPEMDPTSNQVLLMVDFDDWDNALKAARNIQANRPKEIPSLVASTPNFYQWSTSIPMLQYEAQIEQWKELSDAQHKNSRIEVTTVGANITIHVHGDDMASAGALKVRVEKLARGEVLEGAHWHPSFAYPEESERFLNKVARTSRIHLACHPDSRTLVAYGESQRINEASRMIKTEVNLREQVTTRTTLPDASDDFFARGGFEKIKELVGEENVDWKITSRWSMITMKGGEEATHHLRRLTKESLVQGPTHKSQDETTCPVCFTDTSCPEMLECGHGYCSGCLNLFLKAAKDNKTFPIICVGEDGTCNVPIALPFIRRFLPHHTFKQLLEAAFSAYLEQNPTQYRYCKTPDCRQTYRRQLTNKGTFIRCPSCFAKTCPSCSEYHKNMTCDEYRIHRDPEEQERLNNALASTHGYKRCPRCAVWVEKMGGCNHMSCKCGAHICWICLGIFNAGEIYNHIATH
jgi:hypothetical protein